MTTSFTIPDNMPVLILSSYRSGSTALMQVIGERLNYRTFGEPWHWNVDIREKCSEFFTYKKTNTDYVWKLMPDHLPKESAHLEECLADWGNSYVIRLLRRDIAQQITSWIISMKTDVWNSTQIKQIPHVDIEDDYIEYSVNKHLISLDALQFTKTTSHITLYYEDILDLLVESTYKPTAKPKNYNEVLSKVTTILKQQGRL